MGALDGDDALEGFTLGKLHVKAQAFELTPKTARLAGATELSAGKPIFSSDKPIDIEISIAVGKAKVVVAEKTSLRLGDSQGLTLTADSHELNGLSFSDLTTYEQVVRQAVAEAPVSTPQESGVSKSPGMTSIEEIDAGSTICDMRLADINGDGQVELLLGTEDGCAKAMTTEGEELWRIQTDSAVKAIEAAPLWTDGKMGILAGSDDEKLYALNSTGKLLWTHKCEPYGPALSSYDWWTLDRKAPVRRIVVEDVNADGKPEILLGTGGMQVEMVDADGTLCWRAPVFYGFPTTLLVADLSGNGEKAVMAGCTIRCSTGQVTVFNSEGKTIAVNLFPSGRGGWDLCGVSFMTIAGLHGDGKQKLLVARIGAYNQLTAYDVETKQRDWEYNLGDMITGLCVIENDSGKLITVGDRTGWVCGFDAHGKLLWAEMMPDAVTVMAEFGDDHVVVGCQDGSVQLLDTQGKIVCQYVMDSEIVSIATMDVNGDGALEILTAGKSGRIVTLQPF